MAKAKNAARQFLPKRPDHCWVLERDGGSFSFSSRLCLHRIDALIDAYVPDIDPFEAAMGFNDFRLRKTTYKNPVARPDAYPYYKRMVHHYYSLTNKEKAFLARRIANHA